MIFMCLLETFFCEVPNEDVCPLKKKIGLSFFLSEFFILDTSSLNSELQIFVFPVMLSFVYLVVSFHEWCPI